MSVRTEEGARAVPGRRGDESAGNFRELEGRIGWNGIRTVDEKEYSYVAAYFILFLLPRDGVVNRASRDADNERFWRVGEGR